MPTVNLKYVTRIYPRHHIGNRNRLSYCACVAEGGICTTALKRGEAIIVVLQVVKRFSGGKQWTEATRWRIPCYLQFSPLWREERIRQELEEDATLSQWAEINPFLDPIIVRRIEREAKQAARPYVPRGRPLKYDSPEVKREVQLLQMRLNKARNALAAYPVHTKRRKQVQARINEIQASLKRLQ